MNSVLNFRYIYIFIGIMAEKILKVGILRETKTPPDRRVAVTPALASELIQKFPNVDLRIQSSEMRCFSDEEYKQAGAEIVDDVSKCDILIGVKEVDIPALISKKNYLFFSHTAKEQPYNRELLQQIVRKKITLIDYEYLTNTKNQRLVAFGRWAGIVGAYNGLRAWGKRFQTYNLIPAHECHDLNEMHSELEKVLLPPVKILITGGGRVANGAMETLDPLHYKIVSPTDFLNKDFDEPVICRIDPDQYVKRKDNSAFDLDHFFENPTEYESTFYPFTQVTDLFVPCHFWDPRSPVFMTPESMQEEGFMMQVIADVSCDIKEPIPSTLRASTIADPFYGFDPSTGMETLPFENESITIMAVDNLPGELPRDASEDFGEALLNNVFPSLFGEDSDGIIERATIVKNGNLTERYSYLQDYLEGRNQT